MLQEIDRGGGARRLPRPGSVSKPERAVARGTAARTAERAKADPAVPELVRFVAASFRQHPHINNVFTHISGGNWVRVEEALYAILDPDAARSALTPLAANIIDLMCAERGVTGRILKPYYQALLTAVLGERVAKRLIAHVTCLFLESGAAARAAAGSMDREEA